MKDSDTVSLTANRTSAGTDNLSLFLFFIAQVVKGTLFGYK